MNKEITMKLLNYIKDASLMILALMLIGVSMIYMYFLRKVGAIK